MAYPSFALVAALQVAAANTVTQAASSAQTYTPSPTAAPTLSPAEAPAPAAPTAVPPSTSATPYPASTPEAQKPLSLTCAGGGTASKASGAMVYGNRGWASIVGRRDRSFSDQVDVRLFSGDDRIRLPRTMLPGMHGGDQGWFKLNGLIADARSIRAEAAVNFLNHPKVYIDRVTGSISISGKSGDFSGQCEAVDPNAPAKF